MKTEKIMQHLIGKTYAEISAALSVDEDCGDCCGYADFDVVDYVKGIDGADSAKLFDAVKIEYGDECEHSDRVVVNFIFDLGENKGLILGYDMTAGSVSGWSYGASCVLNYDCEPIASASW